MKKLFKKLLCILMMFSLLLTLCACDTWDNFKKAFIDQSDQTEKTIKIGILEPLTGRTSYDAEDEILGMELAYETLNQVGGYKIELIYEDNRSDTNICPDAAQRLIDQGCAVILGSVSDTLSLSASDVIENGKIPAIAASCTIPVLTKSNEYYLRVSCINSFDASAAADYVYEVLKSDRVAVLLPEDDDFTQEKAELFQSEFETLTGETTFEYTTETVDPETKKTVTETVTHPVVNLTYISGDESDEELELLFSILEDLGYYSIYCLCDKDTSLNLIYQSCQRDFKQYTEEELEALKPETPELTTYSYWNERSEWVEEEGYWDEWGNWIKWVEPEDPEQLPDHFTWIGSSDWEGLEETAKEKYNLPDIAEEDEPEEGEETEDPSGEEEPSEDEPEDSGEGTTEQEEPVTEEESKEGGQEEGETEEGEEDQKDDKDDEEEKEKEKAAYRMAHPYYFLDYVSYTLDYDSSATQTETSDNFLKLYQSKYGEDQTPTDNMALGYDAFLLAYNALQRAIESAQENGTEDSLFDENGVFNRELLLEMLMSTEKLPGVTGSITINSYGDPTKDVLIEAWNGREFKTIYTVVPNYNKDED